MIDENGQVTLIDYGFSSKYLINDDKTAAMAKRKARNFKGNIEYASLNQMNLMWTTS